MSSSGEMGRLKKGIGCLFVLAAKRQPIRGNGWIGKQDVLETPGKRREKKEALASHDILQVAHLNHLTNIYAGNVEIVSICVGKTEIRGGLAMTIKRTQLPDVVPNGRWQMRHSLSRGSKMINRLILSAGFLFPPQISINIITQF